MSTLNELIEQIENPELRKRIADEVTKLNKQKKFGLVFEEHLPECTPLYDIPVKCGALVMQKGGDIKELYYVRSIADGVAECIRKDGSETASIAVDSLVTVAEFGEPIYPYLKPIDSVCNAPDSDLWHTLIEADNYHALQLLEYLYAGKVDCIYIDPPYNTGAHDWKYNNDYVDGNDTYRHSKWLSMMQKRLKLAKKLLNPKDSVLIVTIDEKEYLHLGCLLEEMFPEAKIQMVSSVINAGGSIRVGEFSRTDEYLFFVKLGSAHVFALPLGSEWRGGKQTNEGPVLWRSMLRGGEASARKDRPNMFFPILVSKDTGDVVDVGMSLPFDTPRNCYEIPDNCIAIWPIRKDGSEGRWRIGVETAKQNVKKGYIKANKIGSRLTVSYLASGVVDSIEKGEIIVTGTGKDIKFEIVEDHKIIPGTAWQIASHDASKNGTSIIKSFLGTRAFPFPKSPYAVHDAIRFFVANKPNAIIVDYFAGSGTTLHAINLLNAEDGGHRQCIMVTNNEVNDPVDREQLKKRGFQPGDAEWEAKGIAKYITWPRTVCSIEGHDVNGKPLKGNYIGSDIPMADGFKANANFFKLGFLDKTKVSLGMQFAEMLPTLWMKAGAVGECPALDGKFVPDMLILPQNKMAILNDENCFADFAEKLSEHTEIETVFLVTDYEASFVSMTNDLHGRTTYQLYRDYLDNFRINAGRNAR